VREHLGHHVGDMPRLQVTNLALAVMQAPMLNDASVDLSGPVTRIEEVRRAIITSNQVSKSAGLSAIGTRRDRLSGFADPFRTSGKVCQLCIADPGSP
jgi:hypothetical protein